MRAVIALAGCAATLLAGCGRSEEAEPSSATSAITAQQLVLYWGYSVRHGSSVSSSPGLVVATAAHRETALQNAYAAKLTLCGGNADCLRDAVIGLDLRLCLPSHTPPCLPFFAALEVGWLALVERYAAEHATQLAFLEAKNFQAQGIQLTLTLYRETQNLLRTHAEAQIEGTGTSLNIIYACPSGRAHRGRRLDGDRLTVAGARYSVAGGGLSLVV